MNTLPAFNCAYIEQSESRLDLAAVLPQDAARRLLDLLLADQSFELALQAAQPLPIASEGFARAWISYPLLHIREPESGTWVRLPILAWHVGIAPQTEPGSYRLHYVKGEWAINTSFERVHPLARVAVDTLSELLEVWARDLSLDALPQDAALAALQPQENEAEVRAALEACLFLLPFEEGRPEQNAPLSASVEESRLQPKTESPARVEVSDEQIPPAAPSGKTRPWLTAVPALQLNAEQNRVAQAVFRGESLMVEGETGTGKTYLLASVLPALWSEGGSALLITPGGAVPGDLLHHLEQLGLKNAGVLILPEDELLAKERLLALLEQNPPATPSESEADQAYKKQSRQVRRLREQLDGFAQRLYSQPSQGRFYSDWVARFLFAHQKAGKDLLARSLSPSDYSFSDVELEIVNAELAAHRPLFDRLGTLHHPLNALHAQVFDQSPQAAFALLQEFFQDQLRQGKELYRTYTRLIEDYTQSLQSGYDEYAELLRSQTRDLLEQIDFYVDLYGEGWQRSGAVLKLMGFFSGHHREVSAARDRLFAAYETLVEVFRRYRYFEYRLPNIRQADPAEVRERLRGFLVELERWQGRTPKWVEQKMQEWTTALPVKIEFKRRLEDAERFLLQWLEGMERQSVLERRFRPDGNRVLLRLDFLREALSYLNEIQRHLRDFDVYFAWRSHWLGLSERSRRLVRALCEGQAEDWQAAFEAWYLHRLLQRTAGLPPRVASDKNLPLAEYAEQLQGLRKSIARRSLHVLLQAQAEQHRLWKQQKKHGRSEFSTQSLRDLLQSIGTQALRKACPLVVAAPERARELAAASAGNPWDLMVVESAHRLPASYASVWINAGKQMLLLGSPLDTEPHAGQGSLLFQSSKQTERYASYRLSVPHSKADPQTRMLGPAFAESGFARAVEACLSGYLSKERLQSGIKVEDVNIDLVIAPIYPGAAPIALLCDGWCKAPTWTDYEWALHQRNVLEKNGYVVRYVWSDDWLRDPDRAVQSVVAYVVHWDRQYLPKQ